VGVRVDHSDDHLRVLDGGDEACVQGLPLALQGPKKERKGNVF
jgi:hypothetical protein